MKGNSIIEISKKHLLRKENIIFGLISTFLIVILFLSLTAISFILRYISDTNKYNVLSRTLIVESENKTEEELNSMSDIKHIISNVSELYYNPFWTNVSEFDEENFMGYMGIKALINNDDIKIIDGRNIENEYEIVIPSKFYPHGEFNDFTEDVISKDLMLDGKKLIGTEIKIYSDKGRPEISYGSKDYDLIMEEWKKNRKIIRFKVVGTFDSTKTMTERNVTYVSMKAIDNLKDDKLISGSVTDENGDITYIYSSKRMIIIDDYDNMDEVTQELSNKGFSYSIVLSYDKTEMYLVTLIPLGATIISLIVTFILIKNFISKKFKNREYQLGILKALGFNNTTIKKIEEYENIWIFIINIVIGFMLYLIIFKIISNTSAFFARGDFFSVDINVPYINILVVCLLLLIYVFALTKIIGSKHLKKSVSELLKED